VSPRSLLACALSLGTDRYRQVSTSTPRISNDMRRRPLDFVGSSDDIESKGGHGTVTAANIANDTCGENMYRIIRAALTIVAFSYTAIVPIPTGAQPQNERDAGLMSRVASNETAQGTHGANTGRDLYITHCSACHQAGGEGLPGVFPPLKASGVVNKDDATKHIQVVLNGMQGARAGGVVYAATMPPFAGTLSDDPIAEIINYERRSWGNHGALVTAAQVAAERGRPQ
jgi:mono/diheme cytochrome c family protein